MTDSNTPETQVPKTPITKTPITKIEDGDFKVTVAGTERNIMPDIFIYEKVSSDTYTADEADGDILGPDDSIFKRLGNKTQIGKNISERFKTDTFFIDNNKDNWFGGRKRKQSTRKYSSKKSSDQSRRSLNSRKRSYSRRR